MERSAHKAFPLQVAIALCTILKALCLATMHDIKLVLPTEAEVERWILPQVRTAVGHHFPSHAVDMYFGHFQTHWRSFAATMHTSEADTPIVTKMIADFFKAMSSAIFSPQIEAFRADKSVITIVGGEKQLVCAIPECKVTVTLQFKGSSVDWSNVRRHLMDKHGWKFAKDKKKRDREPESSESSSPQPPAQRLAVSPPSAAEQPSAPIAASPPSSSPAASLLLEEEVVSKYLNTTTDN